MRRLAATLTAAVALAGSVASAQADPSDYGLESVGASISTPKAGWHPDFTISLSLKREANDELPAATRDLFFELPAGLLANPTAVPACSLAQFTLTSLDEATTTAGCPPGSQVGLTEVEVFNKGGVQRFSEPVYNLEPRYGEPARLGFFAASFPVLVGARLRSDTDYGSTAVAEGVSSLVPLLSAQTELWAVPADESHDTQRITPYEAVHNGGAPDTPNGRRPSGLVPRPFMLNPTRCGVTQGINVTAISYASPELRHEAFAPLAPIVGCGLLGFSPKTSLSPTNGQAETGAGLDVQLDFPTDGLEDPDLPADAEMKRAEVILPEGIAVNPSRAGGLGACTQAEFARERFDSGPGEGCPATSRVGDVVAKSPFLEEPAEGGLFVAAPHENPFGTLIALYMALKIPERGVIVKLPIRVDPNPATGQLVATVDGIPQLPVSSVGLHLREGVRSPLVTPSRCGIYESTARFTSWAGQTVTTHPSFEILQGAEGAPCPLGTPPFSPSFVAGTLNNNAGSYSPLYMRLTRDDGDQELTRFSATLPPGLTAKLAGVSECPSSALEAAKAKTGRAEHAAPSCAGSSRIGHLLVGVGVGKTLTYVDGELYLAGPYNGAPLSVAAIVPAVAGPFDIGTVVVRQALRLNPRTAVVTVDGARSDPIPRILAGIPLKVRDIRVHVDRKRFTLNPTSCRRLRVTAELWGAGGDVFSSADDSPRTAAARFQAANCSRLRFQPRLSLKLKGGTERGAHPALRGVYRPKRGDANLAGAVVRLPHSAFLDQAHIRTVCTRVQFAAKACPTGAIYGHATVITPLLDQPLSGPVYLRSSSHELPDIVAALHGQVDVEAVARIDSVNGGLRAHFDNVPDVPVTRAVVAMQGGKKGLIVNSTDLCLNRQRAGAELTAHNAKQRTFNPALQADCGAKHRGPQSRNQVQSTNSQIQ